MYKCINSVFVHLIHSPGKMMYPWSGKKKQLPRLQINVNSHYPQNIQSLKKVTTPIKMPLPLPLFC